MEFKGNIKETGCSYITVEGVTLVWNKDGNVMLCDMKDDDNNKAVKFYFSSADILPLVLWVNDMHELEFSSKQKVDTIYSYMSVSPIGFMNTFRSRWEGVE